MDYLELTHIMKGGIDLHTHSSPSIFPRKQTDWEMIEEAKKYQLYGIVLKAHESCTAGRAQVIQLVEKELKVFGGIVLNYYVGGLNPAAVEVSLKLGGKFVWMPTISSRQHMLHFRGKEGRLFHGVDKVYHPSTGITILDQQHKLKEEVHEILGLVKKYDAIICSGHLSAEEVWMLAAEVKERKIERFLVNHPDMAIAPLPLEIQKELAQQGAFLEKCFLAISSEFRNHVTVQKLSRSIREIGVEQCILVTDFGQDFNENPIRGMGRFIKELHACQITSDDLQTMFVKNPRKLIHS